MNRCLSPWRRSSFRPVDLYQEMDNFLHGFMNDESKAEGSTSFAPRVNVAETETQYEVSADLPGISPDQVSVEVHEGQLLISGERASTTEESDKTFHRVERRFGKFARQISLPENVSEDDITADYQDGVLTVSLPKREKPKPTRIEVKSGSSD